MNTGTKNAASWVVLLLSLAGTGWALYDSTQRLKNLNSRDQEFNFGDTTVAEADSVQFSLNDVISRHLFGVIPAPVKVEKIVVQPPKVVNAPKTQLNLTLTGLFTSPGSGSGFAMIEIARGETSLVAPGNKIGKTDAVLHAIENDHILIERQGQIEKLSLEREGIGLGASVPLEEMTIREVELSAAELSVLSEVGQVQEEQVLNPLIQQGVEQPFTDESFIQAEMAGQFEVAGEPGIDQNDNKIDENEDNLEGNQGEQPDTKVQ